MGLPGFEPESIEPKAISCIDWAKYKQYLDSKYAKCYATQLFGHSRKYCSLLNDVNSILLSKPTIRNNVINALTALSRFLGTYNSFMAEMKAHGIKRARADPVQAFTRIFNSNAHKGLGEWYKNAMTVLKENERLYLRFMLLSGVRATEGVKAFNLIVEFGAKYTEGYYDERTGFLEHFKYPKLFLRSSKNVYISAVPKELLDEISNSKGISYNALDKRLERAGLPMRIKQLRSFYATKMREMGLLSEQIDLVQGRVGKSIFLQHYFKQDALLKICLNEEVILKQYFVCLFDSFVMRTEELTELKGTAIKNIPGMNVLKRIPLPIPPLNEQKRIIEKVDYLMRLCSELESKVKESETASEYLMEAVLKEAFVG